MESSQPRKASRVAQFAGFAVVPLHICGVRMRRLKAGLKAPRMSADGRFPPQSRRADHQRGRPPSRRPPHGAAGGVGDRAGAEQNEDDAHESCHREPMGQKKLPHRRQAGGEDEGRVRQQKA